MLATKILKLCVPTRSMTLRRAAGDAISNLLAQGNAGLDKAGYWGGITTNGLDTPMKFLLQMRDHLAGMEATDLGLAKFIAQGTDQRNVPVTSLCCSA